MKELVALLGNKIFLWIMLVGVSIGAFQINRCQQSRYEEQRSEYERQLNGRLTEKERELQKINKELGIARSELVSKKELISRLEQNNSELDKKFKEFVKYHKLEIESKDSIIARLISNSFGGNSSASIYGCPAIESEVKKCIIPYSWSDTLGRFKLTDPNIFESGNEKFKSEQYFKIYGEIWKQKNGALKTRRVILSEVIKNGDKFVPIDGAQIEIIDSEFVYQNEPDNIEDSKLFRLRVIGSGSLQLIPNFRNLMGIGVEFLNYKGFGANSQLSFDFNKLSNSYLKIGMAYNPTIFNSKLNIGIGTSVGTAFSRIFKNYGLFIDFIFYLNN